MDIHIARRGQPEYPLGAGQMHKPPECLYYRGDLKACLATKRVAIVGSRRMSTYGKQVTTTFARELAEQGIVIVSGLALGVDAQAHHSALAAGGRCLAVLPCPLDNIVPATNRRLAEQIMQAGGVLVSQYPPGSEVYKGNFVARNELVAALSDVLLITEAAAGSGSLHTANFASTMQTEVRAVPGNITSPLSAGTNGLLRAGQAGAVTRTQDVLHALGIFAPRARHLPKGATPQEQQLLDLITHDVHDGEALLAASHQPVTIFNQTLTMLEITGKVIPLGANTWGLP
ncbi:MAG: hypothetical protein JWN82_266 [Candidatus Saccharibacteria bacterium]|nr:hypothetical protein [Candidatus Saccharibacteria bacterium]